VTAIFYGVSPVVIALILHSCYRLAKLGMEGLAAVGHRRRLPLGHGDSAIRGGDPNSSAQVCGCSLLRHAVAAAADGNDATWLALPVRRLLTPPFSANSCSFFLKAGALTFGSGLVIVRSCNKAWCRNMGGSGSGVLIAVAIGMISPGPSSSRRLSSAIWSPDFGALSPRRWAFFFPRSILVLVAAPIFSGIAPTATSRIRQRRLRGGDRHHLGACVLLGRIAIGDWLTILIGLRPSAVLLECKATKRRTHQNVPIAAA